MKKPLQHSALALLLAAGSSLTLADNGIGGMFGLSGKADEKQASANVEANVDLGVDEKIDNAKAKKEQMQREAEERRAAAEAEREQRKDAAEAKREQMKQEAEARKAAAKAKREEMQREAEERQAAREAQSAAEAKAREERKAQAKAEMQARKVKANVKVESEAQQFLGISDTAALALPGFAINRRLRAPVCFVVERWPAVAQKRGEWAKLWRYG